MEHISVVDFAKIIDDEKNFLLDVRTPEEFEIANIGGTLVVLDTLPENLDKIPKNKNIYCLCHHGMRSQYAANFLISQGFSSVYNIVGGIDAWSNQVDPEIPKY